VLKGLWLSIMLEVYSALLPLVNSYVSVRSSWSLVRQILLWVAAGGTCACLYGSLSSACCSEGLHSGIFVTMESQQGDAGYMFLHMESGRLSKGLLCLWGHERLPCGVLCV
jgi:hypothetical protein